MQIPFGSRRLMRRIRFGLAFALAYAFASSLAAGVAMAQEPTTKLLADEAWSNLFADRAVKLPLRIESAAALRGRLVWAVTVGRATLARQEIPLQTDPGKPVVLSIPVQAPPVRPGLVLEAQLTASIFADGKKEPEAVLQKKYWLFPDDPFVERQSGLKKRDITLYDPRQTTANVLKKAGVPFELAERVEALAELNKGLLLIGEGISLREEVGLAELLTKRAAAGLTVVCLAPTDGTLAVPGLEANPRATALTLQRANMIPMLDKHLDGATWTGNVAAVLSGVTFRGEGEQVVGQIQTGSAGWPWLDVRPNEGPGRLLVCGFGIIRHWDASPTPRYLLLRILESTSPRLDEPPARKEP